MNESEKNSGKNFQGMANNYPLEPSKAYCRMFSKDKKHQIVWNIAALLKGLENENFAIEHKNVLRLSEQDGGICANPDYAMETDLTKPCILIKLTDNVEIFIDGNHRLFKARKLNIENIPCYVLPAELHKKYILDFDSNIYEKIASEYSTS
ncbi:MAG: hypothetical protein FWE82_08360 [Defluviitaleaceae bacterium]|nr:hypothetical protein [Defluviitaleaceae bacterium]